MKPRFLLPSFVCLALCGCTTIAKRAFYEAQGAKAEVKVIQAGGATGGLRDRTLRFAPASTDVGGPVVPLSVLQAWDDAASHFQSSSATADARGASAIEIRANILYFEPKSMLGSALLLARVRAVDAAATVLDAMVKTESKSFRAGDEDDLCEEAIEKFLERLTGGRRSRTETKDQGENKSSDGD